MHRNGHIFHILLLTRGALASFELEITSAEGSTTREAEG